MARGFSHSGRSGGGGGSRGGGFSFGGGSRSSGGGFRSSSSSSSSYGGHHSSYHRPRGPRRPWNIPMFGRTVVIAPGTQFLFYILAIVMIFSVIMFSSNVKAIGWKGDEVKAQQEYVEKYETYSETFLDVIEKGQANKADPTKHTNYRVETVTFPVVYRTWYNESNPQTGYYKAFNFEGAEYYFIVYEYMAVDGTTKVDSTFAQYYFQDIPTNGQIEIAHAKIGSEYWAINTDYSLEHNMDYQYDKALLEDLKSDRNGTIISTIIYGALVAGAVLIVVLVVVKKFKNAQKKADLENQKTEAEIAEAKAKAEVAEAQAQKVGRTCKYCEATIPDGADVCPACGSRFFEKDND